MKKLLPLLLCLCGCSTTNITKLVEAAAKDPAHVHIEVRSVYGVITYDRSFPEPVGTNVETTVKTVIH